MIKVILAIFKLDSAQMLVASVLRHVMYHALRCVMCSGLARFVRFPVACAVGFAGMFFLFGRVLCGEMMVVLDVWQICGLPAKLRTGAGALYYGFRAAHAFML